MSALHELTAQQAVALLGRREITSEQLVRACLERIAAREPEVQAWEVIDEERALTEARRIDGLANSPALRGLPVAVKDLIDMADFPTGYGSPLHRDHRPARDAACVAALRTAGAVILGKTVTTEFAVYTPGRTRNPRNLGHTPGGSSSGSAAAVADGMVPAALGSQTAGSVIRPASFCGIVGFKPTFGLLPMAGIRPISPSLDTLGVLVRAVADVPLLLAAMTGRPAVPIAPLPRTPRLGLCRTEIWPNAAADARAALEAVAQRLAAVGAEVREVELGPEFAGLAGGQGTIMAAEAAQSLRFEREQHADLLSQALRAWLEQGARTPAEQLDAARAQADRCRAAFPAAMSGCDALLTLSAPGEAPAGLDSTGDPAFNRIWTLLHVPCASLPAATGNSGLPIGVQLIGRAGGDAQLLSVAAWAEQSLGLVRQSAAG